MEKKTSQRLSTIAILLPDKTTEETQFFSLLNGLFARVPTASIGMGALFFLPSYPEDALPRTQIQLADVPFPTITLDTDRLIYVEVGRFAISSIPPQILPGVIMPEGEATAQAQAQTNKHGWLPEQMPLSKLMMHLHGRVVRVDHTGVVLPAGVVSRSDWDDLLRRLSYVSNIYRYPTGEDWPFILPASAEEFVGEITTFAGGREPKFELVYAEGVTLPIIQIDIETDMKRSEVEAALGTYAVALPGLAEYFLSVYVAHPWPGLLLRFDLRYKSDGPPSEWDTGEWLVRDGGRITPPAE